MVDKDLVVELFDSEQMTDVDWNAFTVRKSIWSFSISDLENTKYLKTCDRDILNRSIVSLEDKIQRIIDIQSIPAE